jgi:iron complex outermembrane receptor protein
MAKRILLYAGMLAPAFLMAAPLAGLGSAAAQAQAAPQIDRVVVTAQRRAEDVQGVPIAISAFTASEITARGLGDISQLDNLAPNVTLDAGSPFSGTTSVLSAYIRGIGQNDFAFNFDPGVGVYVDGVYLARTVGANTDLLDVERIEILKGPQGSLFGRNTIGGAINIVTRDPGDEFAAQLSATTGSFSRADLSGAIDMPITPQLGALFAFSVKNRDGFVDRLSFPGNNVDETNAFLRGGYETDDEEGGVGEITMRGKLRWDGDRARLTLAGDYTSIDQQAQPNILLSTNAGPGSGTLAELYNTCINLPPAALAAIAATPGAPNFPLLCGPRANIGTPLAGVNVDATTANDHFTYGDQFVTGDIDTTYSTGPNFSKVDAYGMALTGELDITDDMMLRSITAFRDLRWKTGIDFDGSPAVINEPSFRMFQEQWSQEFQLNGSAMGGRLDYSSGVYWLRESGELFDYVPFAGGLLQVYGPNSLTTETYAVFADFNYAITDRLSLILGGRYTEEDKEFEGFQTDPNAFTYKISGCNPPGASAALIGAPAQLTCQQALGFPDPANPLRFYPPGRQTQSFDDLSPRIGLEYQASDNVMVYGTYSQGFKSGSWTTRLSNPLAVAPTFGPEEAKSYELGAKSDLVDGRLRLNGAVFFTEYDGVQLNFQQGISPTFQNAGDAEIYGAELEAQAIVADGLSLRGGLGYVHAEYTRIAPGTGIPDSNDLPKTPEWQINIGPQYEHQLAGAGMLRFMADYGFTSSLFNDSENTPELKRGSTHIVNLSATYIAPSDVWEATVGVTNALDERYIVTGQNQAGGGMIIAAYNRPAEWYLTLKARF